MVLLLLSSGVIWAQKPKSAAKIERDVEINVFAVCATVKNKIHMHIKNNVLIQ